MAENAGASSGDKPAGPKAPPKQNPAFRALGLPNWRPRLPSRNWMIFLTVVGSWTGALLYDRREKKKAQHKWSTLVAHLAHQPLSADTLPRRITIYLAAQPGDSLRSAREHFVEYVKPILVAGAMDWEVVEGRREGEVRAGTAERIRRLRRKNGEHTDKPLELDVRMAVEGVRQRAGINECPELQGDLVIGRNTWKEYVRGLHEGWLGPMDPPKEATEAEIKIESSMTEPSTPSQSSISASTSTDVKDIAASPDPELQTSPEGTPLTNEGTNEAAAADTTEKDAKKEEEENKKQEPPPKPIVTPPYNTPASYEEAQLPATVPRAFQPISPIPYPHLLGFLNTPIRMYRFLTRRYVADEVGRQTAALVLANYRPFRQGEHGTQSDAIEWEQQEVLRKEEKDWHAKTIKRVEGDEREREWIDDMVIDRRIGERMRRFEVDAIDEDRANRIGKGAAGRPGRPHLKAGTEDGDDEE